MGEDDSKLERVEGSLMREAMVREEEREDSSGSVRLGWVVLRSAIWARREAEWAERNLSASSYAGSVPVSSRGCQVEVVEEEEDEEAFCSDDEDDEEEEEAAELRAELARLRLCERRSDLQAVLEADVAMVVISA